MVLDLCELEVSVRVDGPGEAPAQLLAIFEVATGVLAHHQIFAGEPSPGDLASFIAEFVHSQSSNEGQRSLGIVPKLATREAAAAISDIGWSICPPSSTRKLRQGAVISAVFGTRIGRITIRAGRNMENRRTNFTLVPTEVVDEVLNRLVHPYECHQLQPCSR